MLWKNTLREIKQSLGRYLAILCIVALGVGFFAGLKVTKSCMIKTADRYIGSRSLFDYELVSTTGFDEKSVEDIKKTGGISKAEGSISCDVLTIDDKDVTRCSKAMLLTEDINKVKLKKGRMPENGRECVIDSHMMQDTGVGSRIRISPDNAGTASGMFRYQSYKVVGIVTSPLYLNYDRGTTDLGDGKLYGYFCLPRSGFDTDTYTEIYACLESKPQGFTKAYTKKIKSMKRPVERSAERAGEDCRKRMMREMFFRQPLYSFAARMPETETYVLDRSANAGYATFDSNAEIVSSIAKVFPVFFFLIAALVCMTTMTRMVVEQRTQLGVLKAIGYSNAQILAKYLFYSGSAGMIGAIAGFLGGTKLFPMVIWKAYGMMYDFSSDVEYVFDAKLALVSIAAALLCTAGVTWLSSARELRSVPAQLMRPKAPRPGKRIFLEKITPVWQRLGFLFKVSMRNIFRYKKRFLMMIIGIGGCTALLVAALGIDTTVAGIGDYQYREIDKFDYTVSFDRDMNKAGQKKFENRLEPGTKVLFLDQENCTLSNDGDSRAAQLVTTDAKNIREFIDLHDGKEKLAYPKKGCVIVCRRFAEHYGAKKGSRVTLKKGAGEMQVTVAGVCDNYINDYVYINEETYEEGLGETPEKSTALVKTADGRSKSGIRSEAADLTDLPGVSGVTLNQDMKDQIGDMMNSLLAVVLVIIMCAGALAFIVLYDLTNINITERIREIATIRVLGFYQGETSSYVFRENFILTGLGALLGLPLGSWLLHFVVSRINVDNVFFRVRITAGDYLFAFVLTFLFAGIVAIVMSRRIRKISMTESLKSVE